MSIQLDRFQFLNTMNWSIKIQYTTYHQLLGVGDAEN